MLGLFIANIVTILALALLVVLEGLTLFAAWRAGAAGARLHIRIVGLFSIIAAVPVLLMALVGSVTLDRSLNPAFMKDVRGFVQNTIDAATLYQESQCWSLLQEARLTAQDLDSAKAFMTADQTMMFNYFSSRAKFLGFTAAAILRSDGSIYQRANIESKLGAPGTAIVKPLPQDFVDARKNEPTCRLLDGDRTFVALRPMTLLPGAFLYAARPVDSFTVEFPKTAQRLVVRYDAFDRHRTQISIAFATMYVSIAIIMLLSATWLGLSFANRLVDPIRKLIGATDQVASGNLFTQVAIDRSEGDFAHLGETFNKMTSELRLQQNRLVAASQLIDERRIFTEAVLSGVPVAVIGVDPRAQDHHDQPVGRAPHRGRRRQRGCADRPAGRGRGARDRGDPGRGADQPAQADPGPDPALAPRPRPALQRAGDQRAIGQGRQERRRHARRHHRRARRAALGRLGRRGASHRPRDQEPADADPALGRAHQAQVRQAPSSSRARTSSISAPIRSSARSTTSSAWSTSSPVLRANAESARLDPRRPRRLRAPARCS